MGCARNISGNGGVLGIVAMGCARNNSGNGGALGIVAMGVH